MNKKGNNKKDNDKKGSDKKQRLHINQVLSKEQILDIKKRINNCILENNLTPNVYDRRFSRF